MAVAAMSLACMDTFSDRVQCYDDAPWPSRDRNSDDDPHNDAEHDADACAITHTEPHTVRYHERLGQRDDPAYR